MTGHAPIVREFSEGSPDAGSAVVACECGWEDPYLWSSVIGARAAYLTHIVGAHFPPEWPGTFDVDYDPEGRTA